MANKLYDEAHIQDIADAIREKNGSSTTYKVSQMGAAVRAIEGSGGGQSGDGTDLALSVLRGTISDLSPFSGLTPIRAGAFMTCSKITTAYFPDCININANAFTSCSSLTTASFPVCKAVGSSAFAGCTSLTSVSFPACRSIYNGAFMSCRKLISVDFSVCKSVNTMAFMTCDSLTTANFPECTTVYTSAFALCRSLTTANFPVCASLGVSAFTGCTSLTSVSFPVCVSVGGSAFAGCSRLATATLSASAFNQRAFSGCSRLMSLTNLYSSVATLSNVNVFSSTPMSISTYTDENGNTLGYGSIYVPASLVASYKTATNWATYADRITSIP